MQAFDRRLDCNSHLLQIYILHTYIMLVLRTPSIVRLHLMLSLLKSGGSLREQPL